MAGEFEFSEYFRFADVGIILQLFFVVFFIFVSIIISNIIIGLTVSKVDELQQDAMVIWSRKTTEQVQALQRGLNRLPGLCDCRTFRRK